MDISSTGLTWSFIVSCAAHKKKKKIFTSPVHHMDSVSCSEINYLLKSRKKTLVFAFRLSLVSHTFVFIYLDPLIPRSGFCVGPIVSYKKHPKDPNLCRNQRASNRVEV